MLRDGFYTWRRDARAILGQVCRLWDSTAMLYPSCHPSEPLTDLHCSRLKSLLRENQPPSDLDKQILAKVEHDIEEYDLAIARLQSAIVSLKSQRDSAKDYVSRHKSLLAPIRRLSNDVLLEIFTYVCSRTILNTSRCFTILHQFDLCQVCKHWRSLVNATPLLWSILETSLYPLKLKVPISDTNLLNLADLFLTKSGNCPLTITLTDHYNDLHPVSVLLLQHADRWLSASFLRCNPPLSSVSSFPQLKHLDLSDSYVQAIPAMPSLESLAIGKPFPLLTFPLPELPWNQLRRLRLYETSPLPHCAFKLFLPSCIQLPRVIAIEFGCDWRAPVSSASQLTFMALQQVNKQ